MQLILLRHPPALGAAGLCYGRLDLEADPAQIAASAAAVAAWPDLPVFTSPARRCLALAQRLHPAPQIIPELQELDFGRWEGLLWDDVPRAELDAWAADIWHYRPGGGESAAMLLARWQRLVSRWQAANVERAVVVSHAGVIRLALAEAGLIAEAARWDWRVEYGRAYVVDV